MPGAAARSRKIGLVSLLNAPRIPGSGTKKEALVLPSRGVFHFRAEGCGALTFCEVRFPRDPARVVGALLSTRKEPAEAGSILLGEVPADSTSSGPAKLSVNRQHFRRGCATHRDAHTSSVQ